MPREPHLSVVIPAFNERARLGPTLEKVVAWLRDCGLSYEIVVVDDGSTDGTAGVAQDLARRHGGMEVVALERNRGKGAAVREGFARSRGELVLFSDADLSTPIEECARMLDVLGNGSGMVIASRSLPGSNLEIRQTWYREGMGKVFNRIVRLLTGIPFRDTQCGFKLLRGDAARALAAEMKEDGFAFDVELILLARRRGLEVRELPVTWRHVPESRVSPVTDAIRMLIALPGILGRSGRYRG